MLFILSGVKTPAETVEEINNAALVEYNSSNKSPMFTKIGETNLSDGCMLVYHKDTKVIYSVSDFKLNSGNFTLMTDENQKPLLYEE